MILARLRRLPPPQHAVLGEIRLLPGLAELAQKGPHLRLGSSIAIATRRRVNDPRRAVAHRNQPQFPGDGDGRPVDAPAQIVDAVIQLRQPLRQRRRQPQHDGIGLQHLDQAGPRAVAGGDAVVGVGRDVDGGRPQPDVWLRLHHRRATPHQRHPVGTLRIGLHQEHALPRRDAPQQSAELGPKPGTLRQAQPVARALLYLLRLRGPGHADRPGHALHRRRHGPGIVVLPVPRHDGHVDHRCVLRHETSGVLQSRLARPRACQCHPEACPPCLR